MILQNIILNDLTLFLISVGCVVWSAHNMCVSERMYDAIGLTTLGLIHLVVSLFLFVETVAFLIDVERGLYGIGLSDLLFVTAVTASNLVLWFFNKRKAMTGKRSIYD